jgi:hypothetical protein
MQLHSASQAQQASVTQQQQQQWQLHNISTLQQDTQLTFRHPAQQQHWQQVCMQQLLPFAAAALCSSSSSIRRPTQPLQQQQQLVFRRHASTGPNLRRKLVGRAAASSDLEQQLVSQGLSAAAVCAVMAVAPSWPSLSKVGCCTALHCTALLCCFKCMSTQLMRLGRLTDLMSAPLPCAISLHLYYFANHKTVLRCAAAVPHRACRTCMRSSTECSA